MQISLLYLSNPNQLNNKIWNKNTENIYNYTQQYCCQKSFFFHSEAGNGFVLSVWALSTIFVWKPLFVVICLRANLQKCKHMLPFCRWLMHWYVYTLFYKNRSINTIVVAINEMRNSKERRKNRNKICWNYDIWFVSWQLAERMYIITWACFCLHFFRWFFRFALQLLSVIYFNGMFG